MRQEHLLNVIESMYAAAVDSSRWATALNALTDLCHLENAALVVVDQKVGLATVNAPRADPDIIMRYSNHWWSKDPTVPCTQSTAVGVITTLSDTGRESYHASEFQNDFWRHSGLGAERLASNLILSDTSFASIVLHAASGRDQITDAAHRNFAAVLPHLRRAVDIQRRHSHLELQARLAQARKTPSTTATLGVDAAGFPIVLDDAAETALLDGRILRLSNGRIALETDHDTEQLYALLRSCQANTGPDLRRGGVLRISGPQGTIRGVIEVLPWVAPAQHNPFAASGPVAVIVLTDLVRREQAARDMIQDRFGLTPAETNMAFAILKGGGREAAAGRLGVSLSTARTHLSRIYEKADVRREADLVRLLSEYLDE